MKKSDINYQKMTKAELIAALKKANEDGFMIQTAYLQALNHNKKLQERLDNAADVYKEFRDKYNKLVAAINKARGKR